MGEDPWNRADNLLALRGFGHPNNPGLDHVVFLKHENQWRVYEGMLTDMKHSENLKIEVRQVGRSAIMDVKRNGTVILDMWVTPGETTRPQAWHIRTPRMIVSMRLVDPSRYELSVEGNNLTIRR